MVVVVEQQDDDTRNAFFSIFLTAKLQRMTDALYKDDTNLVPNEIQYHFLFRLLIAYYLLLDLASKKFSRRLKTPMIR